MADTSNPKIDVWEIDSEGQLRVFKLNLAPGFEGDTLSSSIETLTGLKELNLQESRIRLLPSSIGRLKNLEDLDLFYTKDMLQLLKSIGDLTSLRKLNLYYSGIKSLPSSIGRFMILENLNLSCTKNLSKLPNKIGDLTSLLFLNLRDSGIRALPSSMKRRLDKNLVDLKNSANFSFWSQGGIDNLTRLKKLDLRCYLKNLEDRNLVGIEDLLELLKEPIDV